MLKTLGEQFMVCVLKAEKLKEKVTNGAVKAARGCFRSHVLCWTLFVLQFSTIVTMIISVASKGRADRTNKGKHEVTFPKEIDG